MKAIQSKFLILLLNILIHIPLYAAKLATISKPIADLVGEPIGITARTAYAHIPLYTVQTEPPEACSRIHQLLFNEIVTIIGETAEEYRIQITNAYFITPNSTKHNTTYWTLKTNCTILTDALKPYIPQPITYQNAITLTAPNTVTLIQPWHDHSTHTTFSVGTRFKELPTASDHRYHTVLTFDYKKNEPHHRRISRTHCITTSTLQTALEKRTGMIAIIRSWIHDHSRRSIPYVWGGCSYANRYTGSFKLINKKNIISYDYPKTYHTPATGFDCAGLILRAAQITGIPFFCKNSYTIATELPIITHYDQLRVGDILWIPGHVMLIADLDRNTIIEARGYTHGYGKLQEIPIADEFRGITTIKQFFDIYHTRKPLIRLNKKGTVVATIPHYKIVRLF